MGKHIGCGVEPAARQSDATDQQGTYVRDCRRSGPRGAERLGNRTQLHHKPTCLPG